MKYHKTGIEGCFIVEREKSVDDRGYFYRLADVEEMQRAGICAEFVQVSLSQNKQKGTLRGLHSQTGKSAEDKLVGVTRGEIFDVCVDVRRESSTFGQYVSEILSEDNGKAMYVPKGCAHGFITLCSDSQVLYMMTQYYNGSAERGYHFADPAFGIDWPMPPVIISKKDKSWEFLNP